MEEFPFDDNEFDFVHLFGTAFCVPEDKVRQTFCMDLAAVLTLYHDSGIFSSMYVDLDSSSTCIDGPLQEISRVLKPGGHVEIMEEGT